MTPDELDALAAAATPGPWVCSTDSIIVSDKWFDNDDHSLKNLVASAERYHDANLIALAPTLARDHAALLRWAEKASDALDAYHGIPDERTDCPLCALIAEYDERWGTK